MLLETTIISMKHQFQVHPNLLEVDLEDFNLIKFED